MRKAVIIVRHRKFVPLICAALALLLLSGCAAGESKDSFAEEPSRPDSMSASDVVRREAAPQEEPGGGYADQDYESLELGVTGSAPAERKIIQDAFLEIDTEDAAALYSSILQKAGELGGYEFSSQTNNYEHMSRIEATIKVPPEKLRELTEFIGNAGTVLSSSLSSDDITDSYYDSETRLETKRKSLERYYTLLEEADSMEEIVYIQGVIDSITEDIEAYEGRLRLWDSQTSMATVTLYISQYNDTGIAAERKEISWNALTADDMGYLIKRGFMSIVNFFTSVGQWLLIALLALSPALIIAAIVLTVFLRKRKKSRSAALEAEAVPDVKPAESENTEEDNRE